MNDNEKEIDFYEIYLMQWSIRNDVWDTYIECSKLNKDCRPDVLTDAKTTWDDPKGEKKK